MSDRIELLDIKQAAAFLRVSQTSLRRWTNAGRLPCFRVGGRSERRFQRKDLLALLEQRPTTGSATREGAPDAGGSPVVPGTHLCGLYTSDLARVKQAAGFLADGLHAGSVCFLVATAAVRRRILARLGQARPSLPADREAGRLVLSQYAGAAAGQLEFWHTRFVAATGAGARSLCVVGDLSGGRLAQRGTFGDVLQYEADYERLVARRFPVVTLCQYDVRGLSGLETSQVLQLHRDALRYPVEQLVG
jgi:excisionase family DNA binding protein